MKKKIKILYLLLTAILGVAFVVGGCSSSGNDDDDDVATTLAVVSTFPADLAAGVYRDSQITATFNNAMDPATIVAANFALMQGVTPVAGTVVYDVPTRTAIFAPVGILGVSTAYSATVTTGVRDLAGDPLAANKQWSFTTGPAGLGPAPVGLGTAGTYVILAKTAVSNVPTSAITGNVGLSPAAESYITGFSQTDATGYAVSPQVTGFIYAADMVPPTNTNLTTAVENMETAYTDAAGRSGPDYLDLGAGNIGGMTLTAGLYKWGSGVTIPTDVTLSGGANDDVWIFQISGTLTVTGDVILSGGAKPQNIFWQVATGATLKAGSHFEGIILSQSSITLETGATMNGRALAQTQVVLDGNTVVEP